MYQDLSKEEEKQKARIWSQMIQKSPIKQEANAGLV